MTDTLHNVLVAVDFGDASTRAIAIGGAIAGRCGARLSLLHAEALDAPPYFTPAQIEALEGEAQANQRRAAQFLRKFGARHTTQPFETVIESRTAVDAILHAAAGADLVVMGTHGRRGPSRWWLGSVAERVLRETRVPLLVVHADGGEPPDTLFSKGMVYTAHQPVGDRTRALAAQIARSFSGAMVDAASEDIHVARAAAGATWAAIPAPTPRTASWLSRLGEPLVRACAIPVLFVPEAEGGPTK